MLITVLSLGGTILGATAIAGLLMLYQIRSATDFANSAKAVFAADAGTEWAQYNYFNPTSTLELSPPSFSNGSIVSVTCYAADGTVLQDAYGDPLCGAIGNATTSFASYAIARGISLDAKRAFLVNL
jgi:hypothetical protein